MLNLCVVLATGWTGASGNNSPGTEYPCFFLHPLLKQQRQGPVGSGYGAMWTVGLVQWFPYSYTE